MSCYPIRLAVRGEGIDMPVGASNESTMRDISKQRERESHGIRESLVAFVEFRARDGLVPMGTVYPRNHRRRTTVWTLDRRGPRRSTFPQCLIRYAKASNV